MKQQICYKVSYNLKDGKGMVESNVVVLPELGKYIATLLSSLKETPDSIVLNRVVVVTEA